ncbi:MAG TPA: NAD(P)H-hydrate dehydratase [Thermodesulfovibrionales bacterium]|nr:NAD(P)H-hydrate dehydratase [Thermodesulfovibrionales bacterium]
MKVVTAEEMRVIDRRTIEGYSIPGSVLMERAGLAVAARIKESFSPRKVIIIAGSGNNGGDGLVVARNLYNEGWDVKVFLTVKPEDLKGDALLQYRIAVKFGLEIYPMNEFLTNYSSLITRHCILVDALLGTGISKNVTGLLSEVISYLNRSNVPIISVDIPSGISSDNGQIMGEAVRADYTVTFGLPKRGHLLYPGAQHSGKLFIEDIGFPKELLNSEKLHIELLTKDKVSPLIPQRPRYSHKGNYGHVLIIAGSKGKTGAAIMAAKACLRSGAGLVTLGIPKSLADVFQSRVTEEMILALPDKGDGTLSQRASRVILNFLNERATTLAIGPGIGISSDTKKLMEILIKTSTTPMLIDADGINSLKGERAIFSKVKAPIILTPHPGEMARLLGKQKGVSVKTQDIERNRINVPFSFAKETGTYLVLKGVPTIIAGPDGMAYINSTGNPGMASAGTGDVLTGMISAFLSQGLSPTHASILGVYMHGFAGDSAAAEKGEHPLIATDIIEKIPFAFHSLSHE